MKTPSPYKLQVSPLPAGRFESSQESPAPLPDGFVDDEIIASLISSPAPSRTSPPSSDLILSSDENDFAGWSVSRTSPFRVIAEKQEMLNARPLLEESEPGIGEPHRGSHRWWIAAVTSMASALLFSLLFTSLADRPGSSDGTYSSISKPLNALQSALGSLVP